MDVIKRRPISLPLALALTGMAMLVADPASTQPHPPPPPWEDPMGPPTEPDVWLRRLAGQYRFDGVVKGSGVSGKGDCAAVGTGPGVQCIFNITGQNSNMDPSVALFGLDPGTSSINVMLVND